MNIDGGLAEQDLIDIVQNYIQPVQRQADGTVSLTANGDTQPIEFGGGEAPIGARVKVGTPTLIDCGVTLTYTLAFGYSEVTEDIKANVENVINEYIEALEIGGNLIYNRLGIAILTIPGVADIQDYSFTPPDTWDAEFTPMLTAGAVTNATIDVPGRSYRVGNKTNFVDTGAGSGAVLSVSEIDAYGGIVSFTIDTGGTGYALATTTSEVIRDPTSDMIIGNHEKTTTGLLSVTEKS